MENVRVRFAPSPTGPLHMGGVRTALYNYLFAKKHNGSFILRIEDTDQLRMVPGAEDYIIESLKWCGIEPDEGYGFGDGTYGPYKQSERSELYQNYAKQLVDSGHAYIAFDSVSELDAQREAAKKQGIHSWQYDSSNRNDLRNSLTLPEDEVARLISENQPHVIRIKMPEDVSVTFNDVIRGEVTFNTSLLDDKVLVKGDGLPTYHLANVVDDHLMKISHVIRGEEWLPSTPLHVMLYKFFGWDDQIPQFAHLPLILKPEGKGKLSKRDGDRLGFPVFPLNWKDPQTDEVSVGYRERGFFPEAFLNILVLLGWHSEDDREIFSIEELVAEFSLERVTKSGARFDFDRATWFNQQYLKETEDDFLAKIIEPDARSKGYEQGLPFLTAFCGLMKERVSFINELLDQGYYFFEPVREYDHKTIRKKWKPENAEKFVNLKERLHALPEFTAQEIEQLVKNFMEEHKFGFGDVFPILRIALSGTTKGPGVFEMMELMGKEEIDTRLARAFEEFGSLVATS